MGLVFGELNEVTRCCRFINGHDYVRKRFNIFRLSLYGSQE